MSKLLPLLALLGSLLSLGVQAEPLRVAVTTSFHNSGLADHLLPEIKADTGLSVDLLVVGTGQALALGAAGDVDAVLVHAKAAEEAWVAAGHGPYRREVMYNDFVLVGPGDDPAGVGRAADLNAGLFALAQGEAPFVSRGDDSGTHKAEQSLWQAAGISPDGAWYRETGSGMGAALNTAVALGAYVLTDRASWLNFGNTADHRILFQGDPRLFNQYAFLPVSSTAHPHVQAQAAQVLETWLTSAKGQAEIAAYRVAGQQLFFPNAAP